MALPATITPAQVDAKSPIDEQLMEAIREDLYDLDSRISSAGAFDYQFKINGDLSPLADATRPGTLLKPRCRLDGGLISKDTVFQACRLLLEDFGDGGEIEVDVRAYTFPNAPISAVTPLFSSPIDSIGRVGTAISTQSIARSTSQISTQSIAQWKTPINISSIVDVGIAPQDSLYRQRFRINLSSAPDSDYVVGDTITTSGADDGANNGNFVIASVNEDGGNNIVVYNGSGVEQNGANGTLVLAAWKLTYTNPVSTQFAQGEMVTLASHTSGSNNGQFSIYAINQGGNNIIIKSSTMVAQGGAVGNANVNRWLITASSTVPANYAVGEYAILASHTSGVNDGIFPIRGVNQGGNNICIYNASGAAQAGAAGTFNTNRWALAFASDPSGGVQVGDSIINSGTTAGLSDGTFTVVDVNNNAGNNVVISRGSSNVNYAQGGSGGSTFTLKKMVKFFSNQSSITTNSRIKIQNSPIIVEEDYTVLEVNRGGGSNYNAVIEGGGAAEQFGAAGRVVAESKSIFDTKPSMECPLYSDNFEDTYGRVSDNAVLNSTRKIVSAGTVVMADITKIPYGKARNLTIQLL